MWWIIPYEWDACLDLYNWEFSWSTLPFNILWEVATSIPQWTLIDIFWGFQWAIFWGFWFAQAPGYLTSWLGIGFFELLFVWFVFFWIFTFDWGFLAFIWSAGRTIAIPADFLGPWNLIGGTEIWAFYQLCLVAISVVLVIILFFPGLFGMDPIIDLSGDSATEDDSTTSA